MEKPPQSFDVCIVCALPEEVRAFLDVLRKQGESVLEEGSSPRYHYSYRFATIRNDKGESLNLHVSWLPRYGPQEMTLHLSRVLEEYQPRIAIMTGICAGDSQHVQLGDLVVAERTFTYDNGKFTLDEHGKAVHLHDTMTYQLDANILQFLGLFDEWKPLIGRLERPPSPPEISLKQREVRCHIKAMASGSAVRADHPFEDVQAPVRGTVAIDMEGAAFGLVMSRHPLIPWLVVKGVCDYADQNKNDAYHDYAARASAIYALSFIRAYVTHERLPRQDGQPSRAGPSPLWNVPHLRNSHFTGRDELLDQLNRQLSPETQDDPTTTHRAALTQPQAIKGLGGIGKTQIAVEYAYRSRDQGRYTHTLWVNAASEEMIIASFVTIAELLPAFSAKNETNQRRLVEAVKRWLELCEQRWLLIFDNIDNADDLPNILEYLPQWGNGSILLTTRANAVGSLAASIEVEKMSLMEGSCLLLRRVYGLASHLSPMQVLEHASVEDTNEAGNIVAALDYLPLALDQAGAYIEETGCGFTEYLSVYDTHRKKLLAKRGTQATNYPNSVATTWSLSFQKVKQANPAAAELLRLCAFLAPDKIPEELIRNGAKHWNAQLQQAAVDPFTFDQMIAELLKFSLVTRLAETHMLSIHRLVQAVQMDMMKPKVQRQWAERVVRAVNQVFPDNPNDMASWHQCLRYLDQAQVCNALIEQYMLPLIEAANLLNRTGLYLYEHALYTIAEPLYQRAIAICEQQLGAEHPNTVACLTNLASLYHRQGKYEQAEPLLVRALSIREQQLGATHPGTALILNNLANLYCDQGKYAEAEPLLVRALSIREQQLGATHPWTASSLNNLAELYKVQGKYVEAEPLLVRALSIREQQLEPEHTDVATSLNNLAELYQTQGKYAAAVPLYQRALHIREQQLGSEHPDVAYPLNNLAELYKVQGKYAEAEPLLVRALSIREQQLGATHPETAVILNNLADLYHRQGEYEQAEPLLVRALSIREQQLGATHPNTALILNSLANLYCDQGKYTQAEPLYQRALSIYEPQLGATHPDTALILNNLATLYHRQGKYEQAESLLKRVFSIREQQLGTTHPSTATSLNNLASLYYEQGKYEQAELLYQRALAIDEKAYGPEHPEVATELNNLATLYHEQGKYEQAELLYQRALAIREQQLGPQHPQTARSLNNLASLYYEQGKYEQAESLLRRTLLIREQVLGTDHPATQATRKDYTTLLQTMGHNAEAKKLEKDS